MSFGYAADKVLFSKVTLHLDVKSRIALVGPNGIGKSTLLKCILGENAPLSGMVTRSPKLKIGVFNQHHVDQLDMSSTPLETFQKANLKVQHAAFTVLHAPCAASANTRAASSVSRCAHCFAND